jgi:ABC-2 type transport system ATP-binding protein
MADAVVPPGGGQSSTEAVAFRAPEADEAVRIEHLSKVYRSNWTRKTTRGLDHLDLAVHRGEVFGYLGPNGAGKTTTLKILTGLLKPTAGRAWLLGVPIERIESRRGLGFLPEHPYFYDYLNGLEYLELVAGLSGLSGRARTQAARQWFARTGLGERPHLVLRKYSKGMLQRLGLAAAFVHQPRLVILDEPMSGLDPFGRRDVRDLILEQRDRGVTVMFSSHILPDVEMLCDRVAILLGGRLERVATVSELVNGAGAAVEIRVEGSPMLEVPAGMSGCLTLSRRPGEAIFRLADAARLQELLALLVQQRIMIRAVTPQRGTLEELFVATASSVARPAEVERRSA